MRVANYHEVTEECVSNAPPLTSLLLPSYFPLTSLLVSSYYLHIFSSSPSPKRHPAISTEPTPFVVRLMSACCPLVVRFKSGQQADIKRTTSGQQTDKYRPKTQGKPFASATQAHIGFNSLLLYLGCLCDTPRRFAAPLSERGMGCRIVLIINNCQHLSMGRRRAIPSRKREKELPVAVPIAKR